MRLSAQRFNAAARAPSQSVLWRQSNSCPCRDPFSGAARQGCLQCAGKGVLWQPAQPAWAVLAGMKVAKEWAAFGLWESGDVVVSIPSDSPLYDAGPNDRVLLLNSTEPFDSILAHTGSETLPGQLVSVERVFWLDANQNIIQGALPTQNADGTLSWASGGDQTGLATETGEVIETEGGQALGGTYGAPPLETQYTICGRRNPEYFVFKDLPQDRAHFGGAKLPRRVSLRRFDLFGR